MFKQNQKTFSATLVFNISSVHEVMLWFCKMSKLLRGVVLLFLFFCVLLVRSIIHIVPDCFFKSADCE